MPGVVSRARQGMSCRLSAEGVGHYIGSALHFFTPAIHQMHFTHLDLKVTT